MTTTQAPEGVERLRQLMEGRDDAELLDPHGVECYEATVGDLRRALSVPVNGEGLGSSADADTHRATDGAVLAFNHFIRGAQACREMMARFVAATHPEIATSIRLNWHPGWGEDPGQPPYVVDTWEPAPCLEGEALYAAYQASEHDPEPDLALTARMLETWGPVVEPASPDGRISFTRAMMASAAETIRSHLRQTAETPTGDEK